MPEALDPASCRPYYPAQSRLISSLFVSIRDNGQIVPALVRPIPTTDPQQYEIICGHRRHAAILELNRDGIPTPLLAEIRTLSDADAFRLADIDNRQRTDISDYQRAQTYAHALHTLHAGSQRAMSEQLGLSTSAISRTLDLAALPESVLDAFYDRDLILIAHAVALKPLLKSLPTADRILLAAKSLLTQQRLRRMAGRDIICAATILARLLQAANPAPVIPKHAIRNPAGDLLARGQRTATGAISLQIPPPATPQTCPAPELIVAIEEILTKLSMQ